MWMQQFDECNDTKARNRLSLADRMRAIEAYEKTPVYQKVGLMFNCSAKQIRNIVKNKRKIVAMYNSGLMSNDDSLNGMAKTPPKVDERAKKVALLGKVMREWLQRARRNPSIGGITYKLLQTVALDVKDALNLENFYPNNAWLINFRHSNNLTDVDMKAPYSDDPGPTSLDIPEIVDYVNDQEEHAEAQSHYENNWADEVPGWNDDSLASSTMQSHSHIPNSIATTSSRASSLSLCNDEPKSKFPKLEPVDVIVVDSDDDDEAPNGKSHKRSAITNTDQALLHLKPLEEFALMKEDYRAIGLIAQLEAILTNAKRNANKSH